MAAQGGYRKPGNPAPVSGPGSLSRRTDGRVAEGYAYGMKSKSTSRQLLRLLLRLQRL
jgi:hypothetical protein